MNLKNKSNITLCQKEVIIERSSENFYVILAIMSLLSIMILLLSLFLIQRFCDSSFFQFFIAKLDFKSKKTYSKLYETDQDANLDAENITITKTIVQKRINDSLNSTKKNLWSRSNFVFTENDKDKALKDIFDFSDKRRIILIEEEEDYDNLLKMQEELLQIYEDIIFAKK